MSKLKIVTLLFTITAFFYSFSTARFARLTYVKGKSVFTKKLNTYQSQVDFVIKDEVFDSVSSMIYTIDNGAEISIIPVNGMFSVITKPGTYRFKLTYGNKFDEIFINNLFIKKRNILEIILFPKTKKELNKVYENE
jgi:hypothetical protein